MKRAHLVFFCLVIAAPLYAQTITKVTLTGGSITAGPGSAYGEYPVTSFLTAPGYTITNVSGDDPGNVGIGTACYNGCTLAQIASYIGSEFGIIGFPPNGSMAVNGQPFRMWGFPGFIATSFNSSVGADDVLTVYGTAAGYGTFNECDLNCGSLPDEVDFRVATEWTYIGQFVPNPYVPGTYVLQSMLISLGPVPLINQPLIPESIAPGESGFTLTINGAGFSHTAVVNWNGSSRPTTFVSSTQLTATIGTSDVATPQTAQVTVVNEPNGTSSNTGLLEVTSATSSVSMNQTFSHIDSDYHRWMAVGDFNGDGKPDIVVTDQNAKNVSVFLGNGDGTFRPPVNSSTTLNVESVTVGDFNSDGRLDIAVSDGVSIVAVLLGNGDGSFQAPLVIPEAFPNALSLAVADFNADGVLDLAVANQSSNSVSVLLGNGDGTFQAASIYVTGTVPVSVAVGDFNGDGALDLVTANRTSNTISILRGIPGGTFQNQTEYTGGTSPISVIVADVNADGKVDVVVANQNSMTVSVFLGNGDGTFQPKVDYATSTTYSYALLSGDFNGDGKVDVATVGDSNVSILFGNGDGSFQGPITVAQVPGFAEGAADFNDDGRLDLATTYAGSVAVLSQVPYGKVSPTALNFGPVLLGEASPTRLVALSNIGSSELTAPSISISGDFAISNNSCTKGVKPETHCNVDVTFTPTALGLETGALTFTDNAPNSPQTISLTGTGSNMAATTTRLTSSQSPSLYKQSVTFAATVTSAPSATITGTVSFMDGTSLLRSVALASGIASFTTVALTPGSHSITAAYNGSSNYLSSTSAVVTQTVNPAATAATLAAAPNPSSFGETVKLTATVKSGTLPATGSVTFKNGTITLGTGTLSASGVATLNVTTLPVGTDSLTIVYPGNTDFQRSTSTAVNEVVNKAKTTTTVQSSPNPAPHGTAVTFTATIKPPFSGSSTGTVTFKDGTTTLKTVPVSAGAAKYTTSTLATGTHNITATYNGSTDFTGSSGALVQTVN